MSNKETKARVANAFCAMKAIGISEDKVKPVLKSLLKLYDKTWSLIEGENYRALADAIFEREESEAAEPSKKIVIAETKRHLDEEDPATEDLERRLKRLRPRQQDCQSSSNRSADRVAITQSVIPKEEPNDLRESSAPQPNASMAIVESPQSNSQVVTPQSCDKNKGKQHVYPTSFTIHEGGDLFKPSSTSRSQQKAPLKTYSRSPHSMKLRDRGTGADSPQIPSTGKGPVPENSANTACLKESKFKTGILLSPEKDSTASHALLKPKDEPLINDIPCLELGAISHSDASNGGDSSSRNCMFRESCPPETLALLSISEKDATDGITTLNQQRNDGELPMTTRECSSNLEIISSLSGEVKITLSLAPGRSDFIMPSLEAVLNHVKDKSFRSFKNLDPNISIMSLMKETCECFLELGTSGADTLGAGGLCLADSCSVPKLPQTPVLPSSCNGASDGPQLNKMDAADRENKRNCNEEANASSLNVVQQPAVIPETIKSLYDGVDIAKGREKVKITLVNEVNDELPPSFYYIPQNASFQDAYLNFALARIGDKNCCAACSGDCLSSSLPCACAHQTRGEFAYTTGGLVREELLKECISLKRNPTKRRQFFCKECPLERSKCEDIIEPCKGHTTRKFIKECWWKCGCNRQCGNRVVQRGISCNLQVFLTPEGKGWGLRTLQDLQKGVFVCEYVGEVLTNAELFERVLNGPEGEKHSYPVLLDAGWCAKGVLKDEEALCLDATYYGNVARFINHRCYDSNLVEIPVEVETPDHRYYHVAFFTTRKVKAMEELTWDYGIDFDDQEHPIKAFRCRCGSKFCCNIKRYKSRSGR